jgi:hypothetical protein
MFNWIKRLFRRGKKQESKQRYVTPSHVSQTVTHYGKQRGLQSVHIPHSHVLDEDERRRYTRDSDTGVGSFVTGFALGSLLNSGSDPAPSYVDSSPSPSFDSGFSGGASGGGGADSSWDSAPSCDTSSFDSGSSSFDSGSSCSDFSGGGSSDFGS